MISTRITRTIRVFKRTMAALTFTAAATLAGCAHQHKCLPTRTPDNVRISVEANGDPRVGEVTFIRQFHPSFLTASLKNIGPALEDLVGRSQWHIANYLQTHGFTHVFDEGRTTDLTPNNRHKDAAFQARAQIARMFSPQGLGPQPTPDQVAIFGTSPIMPNGANFYAVFHPNVHLHKVWSPKAEKQYEEIARQQGETDEIKMVWREKLVVDEIMRFLEANPGAKVALVFGSAHEFKDDFASLPNPPLLRTVSFPRIVYDAAQQESELCPILKDNF